MRGWLARTMLVRMTLAAASFAACGLGATGLAACAGGGGAAGSGGGGGAAGSGGGGGTADVPCGAHPLDCAEGETCWFGDDGFVCTPSGEAMPGEPCEPTIGKATCADDLLCVAVGGGEGACTKLCDPAIDDTCGEALCVLVQTETGAETHVCD